MRIAEESLLVFGFFAPLALYAHLSIDALTV